MEGRSEAGRVDERGERHNKQQTNKKIPEVEKTPREENRGEA